MTKNPLGPKARSNHQWPHKTKEINFSEDQKCSVNLKVLKSVFQVSRVFVFFPKKLLKSPRTMDKIINDMLINLMSNFKPG